MLQTLPAVSMTSQCAQPTNHVMSYASPTGGAVTEPLSINLPVSDISPGDHAASPPPPMMHAGTAYSDTLRAGCHSAALDVGLSRSRLLAGLDNATIQRLHCTLLLLCGHGAIPLSVATGCSGSDAAITALADLRHPFPGFSISHQFSTESDAAKQGYLRVCFPDCPLLFGDMTYMSQLNALNIKDPDHATVTSIPTPSVYIAGWSCKDLSVQSTRRAPMRATGAFGAGVGSSGSTYHSTLAYIKCHRPRFVLMENVPDVMTYKVKITQASPVPSMC